MDFYYFAFPFWRGDLPRMLIHMGGLEVKDHKVESLAPLVKDGTAPFNQLPVLKVGDVTITQALGIVKFLAKRGGYYPTDDVLAAKCDEVLLMLENVSTVLSGVLRTPKEKKKEAFDNYMEKDTNFKNINSLIGDRNFAVGDSLTVADLMIYSIIPWMSTSPMVADVIEKDTFAKYEGIQRAVASVEKDAKFMEWKASLQK